MCKHLPNMILQEWYEILLFCMCKENSLKTLPSLNREKMKVKEIV